MILPVAAFAMASAGALGTAKSQDGDAAALLAGYRLTGNPQQPCEFVKMCSDNPANPVCTIDDTTTGIQLWHQVDEDSPCNIAVYRP